MCADMPAGRPTGYDPSFHPELAFKLCLLGATDNEMADCFKISQDTLYEWRSKHPELSESCARGKAEADAHMAHSLYHRGLGWSHEAVKIFMPAGAEKPVYAPFIEHFPPDTNAASLWLRNRRGKKREPTEAVMWADRVEQEVSGSIALEALFQRKDEMKTIEHTATEEIESAKTVPTPQAIEDKR
jgi:hypothetical protein